MLQTRAQTRAVGGLFGGGEPARGCSRSVGAAVRGNWPKGLQVQKRPGRVSSMCMTRGWSPGSAERVQGAGVELGRKETEAASGAAGLGRARKDCGTGCTGTRWGKVKPRRPPCWLSIVSMVLSSMHSDRLLCLSLSSLPHLGLRLGFAHNLVFSSLGKAQFPSPMTTAFPCFILHRTQRKDSECTPVPNGPLQEESIYSGC